MELTDRQRELLEFERRWPKYNGDKIRAVSEFFDHTMRDYERLLEKVLELPSAREYDGELVSRARRLRRGQRWYFEKQQA